MRLEEPVLIAVELALTQTFKVQLWLAQQQTNLVLLEASLKSDLLSTSLRKETVEEQLQVCSVGLAFKVSHPVPSQ
jgi:hypothetical protein